MTSTNTKYDVYHIEMPHTCNNSYGIAVVRKVKRNEFIKHIIKITRYMALFPIRTKTHLSIKYDMFFHGEIFVQDGELWAYTKHLFDISHVTQYVVSIDSGGARCW